MKIFYYLLIPFLLSSCTANNNINSFSNSQTDVITFSKSVIKNQSTALDKLMSGLLSKVEKKDGYTIFNAEFFPGNGIKSVRNSFIDYCKQGNGKFSNGVCIKPKGVRFYFKSWLTGSRASNLDEVAFTVVSPTQNSNNNNFVKKIRSLGYVGSLTNSLAKVNTTGKCEVFIFYDLNRASEVNLFNNGKKVAKLNSGTYVNYLVEENSSNNFVIRKKMLFDINGDKYGKFNFQCRNEEPFFVGLGVEANYFIRTYVVPFGGGVRSGVIAGSTITLFKLDKLTIDAIKNDRNIQMPIL